MQIVISSQIGTDNIINQNNSIMKCSYNCVLSFLLFAMTLLSGCQEEKRNTEPLVDPWLRERTPVSLRLESQIGAAVISSDWRNDDRGYVSVSLVTGGLDLSKVKVISIDFEYPESEYCPQANIGPGSIIDLSDGSADFIVTAYNGETRTYTITYEPFKDPLEGVYTHVPVTGFLDPSNAPKCSMILYGGWPDAVVLSTAMDKWWHWGDGYTPADEEDNSISFMLTKVNDITGDTYGTIVNTAGADGKYANYSYNNSMDVNSLYRIIPAGSSRWSKDSSGRISIYDKDDQTWSNPLYSFTLMPSGKYSYGGKDLIVDKLAMMREFTYGDDEWVYDWNWPDTRWMVNNVRNTFWMVEKVSDEPIENHSELF